MRFWLTAVCLSGMSLLCLIRPIAGQNRAAQLEAQRLDQQMSQLYLAGRYDEAIPLAERVIAILERTSGKEHPDTAKAVRSLAILHIAKGDNERADPLVQRSLAILQIAYGQDHPIVADSLTYLSVFYLRRGDYGRAELVLQRALKIVEKAWGTEHLAGALVMDNLGEVYSARGDYARAETFYQRALQIREKLLGANHPDVAIVLNNLAGLYSRKGDYGRAEQLYIRSVTIIENRLGKAHPNLATALNNLAAVYSNKRDFARAETLYKRALAIRENAFGAGHPDVANSINNLGELYWMKGDYAKAEPLYERALSIMEKEFGVEHPKLITILNNLGAMNSATGNYERSESIYQRALVLGQKLYGNNHPEVALVLSNLSCLYAIKGNYARALASLKRALEIEEKNLAPILATGSQQRKQAYLNTLLGTTFAAVTLHVRDMSDNAEAARLALTVILQRKGRVLDAMSDQITSLRRHANPDHQKLLDQLVNTRSRLATLQLSGAGHLSSETRDSQIAKLKAEEELLENTISGSSAEFRTSTQSISLDAVRQTVPPDAVLVELFAYHPFNPKTGGQLFGEPQYVAYVLRRNDAVPQSIELGDAVTIDKLAGDLRAAVRDPKRQDVKQLARTLDERVMRPIRKLIGPARQIFIAPDGALNLIPFASLVGENGEYLIENYSINYLTSGRDLLRLRATGESRESPKVFADPKYDLPASREPQLTTSSSALSNTDNLASTVFGARSYTPLAGTAAEAAALGKLFPEATLLLQAQATEATLKRVNRPRFLHIATHGFFQSDQPNPAISRARKFGLDSGSESLATAPGENPLLRSGLILAGVKQQASGPGEDGVLTALEVSGLDLWGTKLVVLSACETGLGDVKNGEGVYGLRRALVLAGSETQVMSLWKVSDSGTRDLMTAYYTRLQKGEGRGEALRQVQLMMLRGKSKPAGDSGKRGTTDPDESGAAKDYRHPYYWAAFIQSGNWRNLDGK